MSFTEKLKVEIESVFNGKGFKQLRADLGKASNRLDMMNSKAAGMSGLTNQAGVMRTAFQEAGMEFRNVNKSLDNLSNKQLGGMISNIPNADLEMAKRQIKELGGFVLDSKGRMVGLSSAAREASAEISRMQRLQGLMNTPMQNPSELMGSGFNPEMFRVPSIDAKILENPQQSIRFVKQMTGSVSRLDRGLRKIRVSAKSAAGSIAGLTGSLAAAAPAARKLQMRLLGLQFTMLTVAFVFGGLMAGALGAVGVFEVLGNTLRFFFLPTALNVLDGVLDLQETLMGMDRSTREMIGNVFFAISAFAVFIGIAAALGKAVVTVIGFLGTLSSVAGTIVSALTGISTAASGLIGTLTTIGGGSLLTGIKVAFALAKQTIMGMLGSLAAAASFLAGFAGGFLIVTRTAKRFGKTVAKWVGIILAVLAGVGAVIAASLGAPFILVAGLIGVALGAIAGLIWTFKDTIIGVFAALVKGIFIYISTLTTALIKAFNFIVDSIVSILGHLVKMVIGNSIIPDMVRDIVAFIMSIPSRIVNLGKNIVDVIVKGIKNTASSIWDAFKSILPEFLVDAIEGAGGAVKGLAKAGGEVVSATGETIGKVGEGFNDAVEGVKNFGSDMVEGGKNLVSNVPGVDFGGSGGGNNGGGQTKVQQNNINVDAEVNNSEETAQETGTQLAQSINNETERKWGMKNP